MFIDASAIIAIISLEDDHVTLTKRVETAATRYVSALAVWEAARGLSKKRAWSTDDTETIVRQFLDAIAAIHVPVDEQIGREAMRAHRLFGKGCHPAALNFGDCFAYACAKTLSVPLLAKGNDFPQTDIELA
jgi:ribonuclease VapC